MQNLMTRTHGLLQLSVEPLARQTWIKEIKRTDSDQVISIVLDTNKSLSSILLQW